MKKKYWVFLPVVFILFFYFMPIFIYEEKTYHETEKENNFVKSLMYVVPSRDDSLMKYYFGSPFRFVILFELKDSVTDISISKITIKSNDGQNFLIWNNEELLNSLKSLDQKNGYYLVVDNVDIEYIDYQMEIKYSITEGDSVYENMIYLPIAKNHIKEQVSLFELGLGI